MLCMVGGCCRHYPRILSSNLKTNSGLIRQQVRLDAQPLLAVLVFCLSPITQVLAQWSGT